MPYPTQLNGYMVDIGGTSCGSLSQLMELVSGANPPQYKEVSGSGDFAICRCTRIDLGGGQYTWELRIRNNNAGPCTGNKLFRKTVAADDPVGDYCIYANGQINCSAGQAGVSTI